VAQEKLDGIGRALGAVHNVIGETKKVTEASGVERPTPMPAKPQVSADAWPTADEVRQLLGEWYQALADVREGYRTIAAERRHGLMLPPVAPG
jgi:hypothetical protein